MIKKFISLIMTLLISLVLFNPALSNENSLKIKYINKTKVYIIVASPEKIKESRTLKGYSSGINCSFFNVNTRKTVPVGLYNRPFIAFKKDGTIVLSDEVGKFSSEDKLVSGGSWLVKEGEIYSTKDHFNKNFKNLRVRRTCIGISKSGKVLLVVFNASTLKNASSIMRMLGCVDAVALDGGTSTQMKYNGKMILSSPRGVANYLVIQDSK